MVSEDIIKEAAKPQTLEPGMACKCGPAMQTAIMERAKELGLWDRDAREIETTDGIWVIDFGSRSGNLHPLSSSHANPDLRVIPYPEFLRLMENTKPPVKELTTEEKLAKAVEVIEELRNAAADVSYYNSSRKNLNLGMTNDHKQAVWNNLKGQCVAASAFLKSIKG